MSGFSRAFALTIAALGCAPSGALGHAPESGTARSGSSEKGNRSCEYDVTVARPIARLDVSLRCTGSSITDYSARRDVAPFIDGVRDENGRPLAARDARWANPSGGLAVRYSVDLDRAAQYFGDYDIALRIGGSLLAPTSSILLAPNPIWGNASVALRVHPGEGGFATGLDPGGGGYSFLASDLPFATYSVFGKFDAESIDLPWLDAQSGATIDTAILDGHLALPKDAWLGWVRRAARGVADYYGGFPVKRSLLALVPVEERSGVLHGNVLPAGGSAVVVLVGEKATQVELDRDWILVHELFHLGFPSFIHEGSWLDEGLATYVEPIIRARLGLLNESETWRELTVGMPRGVRLCEGAGLEHYGDDYRAVYWGGAVVALLADVEALKRTHGEKSLEDGLRAVVRDGGDARNVWRVDRALRIIDLAIGSPVLEELATRYQYAGAPVPLGAVLADLGVERLGDVVRLHDDAPLAAIRKRIVWGRAGPPEVDRFERPAW